MARGHSKQSLLRLEQVRDRTGMSRSGVYVAMREGSFPRPIKIGTRAVAWVESDIDDWIQDRIWAHRGGVQ